MKRYFSIVAVALVVFILWGCQGTGGDETKESTGECNTNVADEEQDISIYKDILDDYVSIVDFRLSEEFESKWNAPGNWEWSDSIAAALSDIEGERATGGNSLATKWDSMVIEMKSGLKSPMVDDFKYILRDVNGDDIPELFWVRSDDMILAVFTQHEGQVVLMDAFWPRYRCVLTDAGELYTRGSGGAGVNHYEIRKITPDAKLLLVKNFGMDVHGTPEDEYYETIDGNKIIISEERYEELLKEYPFQ